GSGEARPRGGETRREGGEPARVQAVDGQGEDRLPGPGNPYGATAAKLGEASLDLHLPRRSEQTRNDARVAIAHLLVFHAWTYDRMSNAWNEVGVPFRPTV